MDHRGGEQRPPRSARPTSHSRSPAPAPPYPDPSPPLRPPIQPSESKAGVSFQHIEQGDRQAALDSNRARHLQSAYVPALNSGDPETSEFDARVARKKSLVRPDREKIDPSHRQWHYRSHVAQMEQDGHATVDVMPSSESSAVSPGVHALISLFTRSSPQLRETILNYDGVVLCWLVRRINTNRDLHFSVATHYAERNMHPRLRPRHRAHRKSRKRRVFGKARGLVVLG